MDMQPYMARSRGNADLGVGGTDYGRKPHALGFETVFLLPVKLGQHVPRGMRAVTLVAVQQLQPNITKITQDDLAIFGTRSHCQN